MAVSGKVVPNAVVGQFGGAGNGTAQAARRVDWLSDTIKVALATSSVTGLNQTTCCYLDSLSANEVTGTGYTQGGVTLGSKTATKSSLVTSLDAADASWTTATITARYAIIYKLVGTGVFATDTTSPILGYVDFGADATATAGTFTITWDSTGIFVYTVA